MKCVKRTTDDRPWRKRLAQYRHAALRNDARETDPYGGVQTETFVDNVLQIFNVLDLIVRRYIPVFRIASGGTEDLIQYFL